MEADIHEFTAAGNMRPPKLDKFCGWIAKAWALIAPEVVWKLFVSCGIITAIDGNEDKEIFCLQGKELESACQML